MSKGSDDLITGDKTSTNTNIFTPSVVNTATTATNFNNGISFSSGGTVTATTFNGNLISSIKPYLQASDTTDQQPASTAPTLVTMNQTDLSSNITHSAGVVTIQVAGIYYIMAAGQCGMTVNSNINCHLWFRKNNVDIPDSNTRAHLTTTDDSVVLVTQAIVSFAVNDTLKIYQSINVTGKGAGLLHSSPAGEPEIPSMIFSMYKIF